ncbi:MAG: ATP-binding cassette domain-containing protein, partial [Balneolaceae bacterium]|nr:ATP-binding cassette domain-containing protein [Balneolaceae bacterium]
WFRQQQELSKGDLQHIAGYAASYINLYRELSLMENLAFIQRLRGEHFSAARARELLQVAGLGDQCDQPFGKLSTGQQQRARLTSALITDPFILLLDEPGSNLDEGGKAFVADTIASFCEKGKLVILASNNREELDLADRIYSVADLTFEH